MAACGVSNKHIAALVLVILALVLHVIGFSAPYWYFQKFAKTESYSGLWSVCVAISGGSTECSNGSNLPAWLVGVQAMETLGLVLIVAALVVLLVTMFCLKTKMFLKYIVIALLISAAVCILIGVIIYGAEAGSPTTDHLHFAFAFVIIAAGVAIISSVFVCI
ncbi:unnamed protein product [Mytilus edulis]|uniref:Uncharacterized protein n=1 Tax=Mytilus edulis TaxID=6550 RepID=A0A8S3S6H4_MYTED|nr:unnamed protein product [Mytilus edulis]